MYSDAAAWRAGPEKIYRLLALPAVGLIPDDLHDAWAADAGAGTGVAASALAARGARVIAVDMSEPMLRLAPGYRVVADVARLPLRTGSMSAAVACLVLSHVDDPRRALAELARVTSPGGTVTVTAFPAGPAHPVKEAAGRILASAGYLIPDWYRGVKSAGESAVGTPEALHALAAGAGLSPLVLVRHEVSLAGLTADELVAWRLGMAPVAAWLSSRPGRRAHVAAQIKAALPRAVEPLPLLIMVAQR